MCIGVLLVLIGFPSLVCNTGQQLILARSLDNEDGISEDTDHQMSYHQPDLYLCRDKEWIQKAEREPNSKPEATGTESSLLLVKEQYASQTYTASIMCAVAVR